MNQLHTHPPFQMPVWAENLAASLPVASTIVQLPSLATERGSSSS